MSAFLLQLFLHQAVAPLHYLLNEGAVLLEGAEITAAPQHQGLVDGVLEPVVGLLGHAFSWDSPELIRVDSSP